MSLKVNFCGAPSSGKSLIASKVEAHLKTEGLIVDTSKEYAREYINNFGIPKDLYEQMIVTETQKKRDEAVAKHNQIMLSDYPVVNSYIFSNLMLYELIEESGRKKSEMTLQEKNFLKQMHEFTLDRIHWYDIIIFFPPIQEFVEDGTRNHNSENFAHIARASEGFLNAEYIDYHYLDGTIDEKTEGALKIIKSELNS